MDKSIINEVSMNKSLYQSKVIGTSTIFNNSLSPLERDLHLKKYLNLIKIKINLDLE